MRIIIIGGSIAAYTALETLIKYGKDLEITLITEEEHIFYSKCLLTYLLGQEIGEKELFFSSSKKYKGFIKLFSSTKATTTDNKNKKVFCNNGLSFDYDKLIIATGADPIKPTYCKEENRAITIRYKKDIDMIKKYLKDRAIVVGGGYVGLKTAYSLSKLNIDTSVIISSPYPLSVTTDEDTGKTIETEFKKLGIKTYTRTDLKEIVPKNGSIKALLTSELDLTADVCIVGKGVKPRVELLLDSNISVNLGIVVNEYLQTSDKDIYAVGDCAECYDTAREEYYLNAIWPNAVEQAQIAALNILGNHVPYLGSISMNSIKTDTFHLITAGVLKGKEITIYEKRYSSKNQFRKIALQNGRLVGMSFFNNAEDAGFYVNLVKKGNVIVEKPDEFLEKADIKNTYYRPFR